MQLLRTQAQVESRSVERMERECRRWAYLSAVLWFVPGDLPIYHVGLPTHKHSCLLQNTLDAPIIPRLPRMR